MHEKRVDIHKTIKMIGNETVSTTKNLINQLKQTKS